jgi:hypothetical protein
MPRTPFRRLPAGLLAAATLEALDEPRPGAAVVDRLLITGSSGEALRLPNPDVITLLRSEVEIELP